MNKYWNYPKYTREEDLRCRFSDKDIDEMLVLRMSGYTVRHIARVFETPHSVVVYYTNDSYKERHNKISYERPNLLPSEIKNEYMKRYRKRKKEMYKEKRPEQEISGTIGKIED